MALITRTFRELALNVNNFIRCVSDAIVNARQIIVKQKMKSIAKKLQKKSQNQMKPIDKKKETVNNCKKWER